MTVASNLRYSPVNYLIVDWSDPSGNPFENCGLPQPQECGGPNVGASGSCTSDCDDAVPIDEAINTYDWFRWLPEVIVGIDDPDEEIAANYVRQTAIDFCKRGRVLQREVRIHLQHHVHTYPVFPYVGEQIIGVIGTKIDDKNFAFCDGPCSGNLFNHSSWRLDTARNELHLGHRHHRFWPYEPMHGVLKLLVWSAPTEDACTQDVFLYDRFRMAVTQEARRAYATTVHYKDQMLLKSLPPEEAFTKAALLAKTKAMNLPSAMKMEHGSVFRGRQCLTREDYYFYRDG